jgi:hypothetical protein
MRTQAKAVRRSRSTMKFHAQSEGADPMTNDFLIRRITAGLEQAIIDMHSLQREDDVVGLILAGGALSLDEAADVWQCSDETIRKECEASAARNKPIGVKFRGCWIVGKTRLLDLIQQKEGLPARLEAAERAKKYGAVSACERSLHSRR